MDSLSESVNGKRNGCLADLVEVGRGSNTSFTGKVNRESCSTYICTNAKGLKEKGSGVEGPPTNHKACFSERGNYCIRAYSDFFFSFFGTN